MATLELVPVLDTDYWILNPGYLHTCTLAHLGSCAARLEAAPPKGRARLRPGRRGQDARVPRVSNATRRLFAMRLHRIIIHRNNRATGHPTIGAAGTAPGPPLRVDTHRLRTAFYDSMTSKVLMMVPSRAMVTVQYGFAAVVNDEGKIMSADI